MAFLYFDKGAVRALIDACRGRTAFSVPYQPRKTSFVPALWLVGDHGVYLMSACKPPVSHPVVYAQGLNPNVDEFDAWWGLKRETFGGDDGVEPIEIADIEKGLASKNARLVIDIGPKELAVVLELVDQPVQVGGA